jgi:asparagine synthase (glutamine-hydrolysing)
MCGISGVFRFDRPDVPGEDGVALEQMSAVQRHRGPDDSGLGVYPRCALASRRLSILDLSPQGHMPMLGGDGRLALVHNGEIYNYVELRAELRARGHRFRSDGDTEVILRAYQEWGDACVERLVGMWAFALVDLDQQTLLLSRDRFGIKPLYTHQTPERLVFASEIKAIVAYLRARGEPLSPNEASIATYAATGLVDGLEDTFFAGVKRLPAATITRVSADGVRFRRYWHLPSRAAELAGSLNGSASSPDVFGRIERALDEAVRVHLRSDVPVGVCLSGGLDSSAVVGLAARHVPEVRTFTVYFGDGPEFDERPHARAVQRRFGALASEQEVRPDDLLGTLQRIVWHLDEPSLALGVLPQWHVMELAHHRVKVVLDGQGGDEVFAGYTNYLPQHLYAVLAARPGRFPIELAGIGRVHGWPRARAAARSAVAMRVRRPVPPSSRTTPDGRLLAPELRRLADVSHAEWRLWPRVFDDWLTNVLYWELTRTRLPALLRYEDRLSMAFSVESRVPFLDHRLVELAFALPGGLKVHSGWSKYALRRALEPLLPGTVVWRRDKKGFPTPIGRWLRDGRGAAALALLREPDRRTRHLFPAAALGPEIEAHCAGRADRSWQLWRALSTELWLRAFFP